MEKSNELLVLIANFISANPIVAITVFILSLVANIIQVGSYLRDKQRIRQEEFEKQRLSKLVDTYEAVLQIAKETVDDKEKLSALKQEITESASKANELSAKIDVLQKIAQKELVSKAIDYHRGVLSQAFDEIQRLREKYSDIEGLPEIPPSNKTEIESEVQIAIQKPYELPREFLFTSSLLVLLILLVPWPIDAFLLPFLVRFLVLAIFDAVWLYPNRKVKRFASKYYSQITLLVEFGVWFNFFQAISTLVTPLWTGFVSIQMNNSFNDNFWLIMAYLPSILPLPLAILSALPEWKALSKEIYERALPKIDSSIRSTAT